METPRKPFSIGDLKSGVYLATGCVNYFYAAPGFSFKSPLSRDSSFDSAEKSALVESFWERHASR